MTKRLKATFDGKAIVLDEPADLSPGQAVEVQVRVDHVEPVPGSAAASRRLVDELRALPKPDAATMEEFRAGLTAGAQPPAAIGPFGDLVDDPDLVNELNERASRET